MVESDKITAVKVEQEGVFNLKEVYNFFYTWLSDYEYFIEEKEYKEKVKGEEGKDIEIEWNAFRKITDYFKYVLKIKWVIRGVIPVSKGLSKGKLTINVIGFLERDYENKWESSSASKFLRSIYDKYIIKQRIEDYEDRVAEEVDEAIAQLKAFLVLEGKREA